MANSLHATISQRLDVVRVQMHFTGMSSFTTVSGCQSLRREFLVSVQLFSDNEPNEFFINYVLNNSVLHGLLLHFSHMVIFQKNISQGNLVTQTWCGGIFVNHFTTNLLAHLPVKNIKN